MWYNPIMEWLLKSPLHGVLSGNMMIIYFSGRKSGKAYHVPVSYLRKNHTLLSVSSRERTWWRNLRGGVPVVVRLQGRDIKAYAEALEGEGEIEQGLKDFIGGNRRDGRMVGIKVKADGSLDPDSLRQAVMERVIVRTTLQ
jgi:hypothetical protein